jgi:hypothetical protein
MTYGKYFLAALIASLLTVSAPSSRVSAQTPVALELLLAVDASSSVDETEFELQMRGLAEAFRDPGVLAALELTWPRGIAVAVMLWSQESEQVEALDWTPIRSAADALAFAQSLDETPRYVGGGATAVGTAIAEGAAWIESNDYVGERKVIDVSGDGQSNEGVRAAVARAKAMKDGIVVNGLAILNEEPKLARYYLAGVVGGPGSFLLTADDFDDFALAIRRKLFFEIAGPPIADAGGLQKGTAGTNDPAGRRQSASQSLRN